MSSNQEGCNLVCPFARIQDHSSYSSVPDHTQDEELPEQVTQAQLLHAAIRPWQTRVVVLEPGNLGDALRAELSVVDIVQSSGVVLHTEQISIQYDALSYCWGKPDFTQILEINGIVYPITASLYNALQRLRMPNRQRHLWIDALCINQYDLTERAMQVSNMLAIYEKAERVIVWLGEHGANTKLCFRYFQLQERDRRNLDSLQVITRSCSKHATSMYYGLADFFARPWYSRIWIRQEVWAAQQIDVACGDSYAQWEWLPRAAGIAHGLVKRLGGSDEEALCYGERLTGLGKGSAFARATVENATLTSNYRVTAGLGSTPTDLLSVIQRSSPCDCSDARDRVYGVLGMTTVGSMTKLNTTRDDLSYRSHERTASLPVDYTRSVCQVFQDAAVWIMTTHQSLSVLLLEAEYGGNISGDRLPSWCPDWSKPFRLGKCTEYFTVDHKFIERDIVFRGAQLLIEGYKLGIIISVDHETSEDGGTRQYATIQRNDAAVWLASSLVPEFSCEVHGNISFGDQVLFTEYAKCALILRQNIDETLQYIGWVYDFPFMGSKQRALKQEMLTKDAAFSNFVVV